MSQIEYTESSASLVQIWDVRGPTFVFAGGLRCNIDPKKWIIAGSCLVMQPD